VEIAQVTGRYENDRAEIENVWRWNGENYEKGLGEIKCK
jgi:pilus assembly protein CpaF